ncbi:hypothetical protein JCM10212_007069 [Sporobolomyces blumeae]
MTERPSLDELILAKLSELNLRSDEETTEFIKGLVEEESFEQEDRKSAILGMLEVDEEDEAASTAVDALLEATSEHQEEIAAERRAAEAAKAASTKPREEDKVKKVLTPEEEEKRKADLIRQYGRIEEETEADRLAREEAERVPDKALIDPSKLSKKQRKKAFDGVDLLALPNMNSAHVAAKERERRNQDAAKSQAKREKDKADLKKQKDDAAKKLADKQKKAQKVERRG